MKKYMFLSDIHSNIDDLLKIKDLPEYQDGEATIVFLGDYIDGRRQPEKGGLKVLDFVIDEVRNHGAIALYGNHDKMFFETVFGVGSRRDEYFGQWGRNGRDETLLSWGIDPELPSDAIITKLQKEPFIQYAKFLRDLEPAIQLNENIRIAHAGIDWNKSFENQTEFDLIWIRNMYFENTDLKLNENLGFTYVTGHTTNYSICGKSDIIKKEFEENTTLYLIDGGSKGVGEDQSKRINVLLLNEDGSYIKEYTLEGE